MERISFPEWLEEQLKERDWRPADLANAGGIYPATVTRVLNHERHAGVDFCHAIARALNLPPELVFRKAGLLPPKRETTDHTEELLHYYNQLTSQDQARARALIKTLAEERIGYDDKTTPQTQTATSTP